ncbi:phage holin [Sporosarcina psychrophila]|uniref:phage holin n=1 Tax=Sporosarcina psychrophila TaxID=1476 RepID=UPI00078B47B3|nr:phage holin [Sporosarcina psychrophila]AMQ06719.1 PTS mannose transporter subunit IID [Sporosarcina psychrophila]
MDDKLKQYVAMFGGWLSAVLLFLGTLNVKFEWFNQESIDAFVVVLIAAVPFFLIIYGVWKNTYLVRKRAKEQERALKQRGLK